MFAHSNSPPTLTGAGHQRTVSTSIGCSQWLCVAKTILKVALAGRNCSLVARTSKCGWAISSPHRVLATTSTQLLCSRTACCSSITLFKSITMFCGTDNIPRTIPHYQLICREYFVEYCQSHVLNVGNILWNHVSTTKHCYGSE